MSMLLASSGLLDPMGKELAAGLPAFGTCAGMILLGRSVTGGRRGPDAASGPSIWACGATATAVSWPPSSATSTSPALGARPFHAVFIRAPLVESTGAAVEVLALNGAAAAAPDHGGPGVTVTSLIDDPAPTPVLCRQGPVLVAAFHPELTADRRVHGLFVSTIEERGR